MYVSFWNEQGGFMQFLSERAIRGNFVASLHNTRTGRIEKIGCVFLFVATIFFTTSIRAGDGDLDSSFGSGGKVITDFAGGTDIGHAVAVQPDGKIVVVGQSGVDLLFHSALS